MIDQLVELAVKKGHALDTKTVDILRDMEILLEIASAVRGEPNRTYSVAEIDALTAGSVDLKDLIPV